MSASAAFSNITGICCPGCAPGDFAQPHICGIGTTVVPQSQFWPFQPAPPAPCDHRFCLEQKQGNYRIPDDYTGGYYRLKPHKVCCMCLTRRVKEVTSDDQG